MRSSNSFAELEEGKSKSEIDSIEVKYKLVDVNEYKTEELLKENTMFANAMILKQIIKILEECESGENMSTIAERIAKELAEDKRAARAEGMILGIKEGILQTIKRMIKMNFEDTTIKQVTGAKQSEIEKVRKEMQQINL